MPLLRRVLAVLPVLVLAACSGQPAQSNPFVTGRTWNIAHQGGELVRPSNTMTAFRHAAALGVDMLDMDMHMTRDGVLVLSHDTTLDRLTDTRGTIAEMTLAQVLAADAGYAFSPDGRETFPYRGQGVRVAQLSEVLAAFPASPMTIEIKTAQPGVAAPFCTALRTARVTGRVIVASFSDAAMRDFRAACPEVTTSMTESELRPLVLLSKVGLAGLAPLPGAAAQVPVRAGGIEVVTPGFIRAMHARGVAVQVWTINDPAEMRRLMALGVDGIFTDRPDVLKEVLAAGAR
ncbi:MULTISPECIES: glycerophosphodiester phosphodiesterase [Deinococcus]|uniref:Glycerophosphodiester phosphodiesterase n=1 Tax=Deinococcus rufus TaxID=2136097 RepID=A0ABV7Z345_9DEIO|nr:glycerophosphodiester phosphodiesterase [Deinococcus sp. AB2017081]WQE95063.1 glycerophosphodiester phosphodiesterase [Deinococcus sp. AB2017081]